MVIRRERTPEPAELKMAAAQGLAELRTHDRRRTLEKSQRRWPIRLEIVTTPEVKTALVELFADACAYCGSGPLSAITFVDPTWHRPPEAAMQLDRTVSRDHYWWLAYDWRNLYLVCPECRSLKGRTFPTSGTRAAPEAHGKRLAEEKPLLVDPCVDLPERLFGYETDGTIVGTEERSQVTIEVLALNRTNLVADREHVARDVLGVASVVLAGASHDDPVPVDLAALIGDGQSYPGIRRWALRRALLAERAPKQWIRELGLDDAAALALAGRTTRWPAATTVRTGREAQISRVRLERVEIRNFRAIRDLRLTFPSPVSEAEPWILLLGENGVGKSTLLKAVALGLVDEETRRRLAPDAASCVRRGAAAGSVRLGFSDGGETTLGFRKGSPDFEISGPPPPIVVLGYGPTRLPPPASYTAAPPARVDVENLFDPFVPLSDAEKWLADTGEVSTSRFNLHATALKSLLPVTDEDRLLRRGGRLYARVDRTSTPLPELSDGFRSVIAMATDVIMQLSTYWDDVGTAEGLLLVDEIEVHLHPQWRMSIVRLMREVFPRLRVIATTHDPLCLQQTEPGEVVLLRRYDGTGVAAIPLDVPKGLRADQLLTGDWFGLTTTTDQETAALLEEHARLLVARSTPQNRQRRDELEQLLRQRVGRFAETSVERIAQEVVAKEAVRVGMDVTQAQERDRKQLADAVLRAVRARKGGG